jgi:hypothetical protein
MSTVWIVDIDKTIADHTHRDHLLRKSCVSCNTFSNNQSCPNCQCDIFTIPTNSWRAFQDPNLIRLDEPILTAQEVIHKAMRMGIHVHYITGRQPNARTVTQEWLTDHFGFDNTRNKLLLRDIDSYNQPKDKHISAKVHKENKFLLLKEMCGYTDNDTYHFWDDDRTVLVNYSKFGMIYHAPNCWQNMVVKFR